MADGSSPHPLQQVIPRLWRAKNGKTQLSASRSQKGKHLELLMLLHLKDHQPSCTISQNVGQAVELFLGHLLSLARLREFTL
jgi:hypothetical protein